MEPLKKPKHDIRLLQRNQIDLTGVTRLDSFDKSKFRMDTDCGFLTITGTSLAIVDLVLEQGMLTISGQINSVVYGGEGQTRQKSSFWRNLFR
jgi:sporulation protein YabP